MYYDYSRWPNFSKEELVCQHTGLENPNVDEFIILMDAYQELRTWYGYPMIVTSGYRHPSHPEEVRKAHPGMHTLAALDYRVPVKDCYKLVGRMFEMKFTGIGINLTGDRNSRFIHGDFRRVAKALWSY